VEISDRNGHEKFGGRGDDRADADASWGVDSGRTLVFAHYRTLHPHQEPLGMHCGS
jgi:hypothetical protein